MAGGGPVGSLQPVTVNKRLLFGSLAVAAAVVVAVGIVAANRDDAADRDHDDDVTLTSSNDLSPTIGTNAKVTGEQLPDVNVQTLAGDDVRHRRSRRAAAGRQLLVLDLRALQEGAARPSPPRTPSSAIEVRFVGVDSLPAVGRPRRPSPATKACSTSCSTTPNGELTSAVGVAAFPQTLFIDANGHDPRADGRARPRTKLEDLIRTEAAVIALDARLATSFTAGLLAAINPCGFVLLPTYLVYFLGMENLRPGAERASLLRALKVSLAVSGWVHERLRGHRRHHQAVDELVRRKGAVGLAGHRARPARARDRHAVRLPPAVHHARSSTSASATAACRSMYVFGLAYAVASIGCTIGPFTAVVLGSFSTDGRRQRASPRSLCTESAWRWSSPASP